MKSSRSLDVSPSSISAPAFLTLLFPYFPKTELFPFPERVRLLVKDVNAGTSRTTSGFIAGTHAQTMERFCSMLAQ